MEKKGGNGKHPILTEWTPIGEQRLADLFCEEGSHAVCVEGSHAVSRKMKI